MQHSRLLLIRLMFFIWFRLEIADKIEKTANTVDGKHPIENGHSTCSLFTPKNINGSIEKIEAIAKDYNPVKSNYHPVNDAPWKKGEP